MNADERAKAAQVLSKVSWGEFRVFLDTEAASEIAVGLKHVREAVDRCEKTSVGAPSKPTYELVDLFGDRLLSDKAVGAGVREMILRSLSATRWIKLRDEYVSQGNKLYGATQSGKGSTILAERWHRGSKWAKIFCEIADLPIIFAGHRERSPHRDEEILPARPLGQLHSFQKAVYKELRQLIADGRGTSALLSLPTGAGKTRVAVEAICDHLAINAITGDRQSNVVLWIARSTELQEQAWECFRQVWQVSPNRDEGNVERLHPLRIIQLWGGANSDQITISEGATIFIAGAQQLRSWAENHKAFITEFPLNRLACVAIDEAQFTITNEFRTVLCSLGLRKKNSWTMPSDAAFVLGLTATPWRTNDTESVMLRRFFNHNLLKPKSLEGKPISTLQKQGILAKVTPHRLDLPLTTAMTDEERRQTVERGLIPGSYLQRLGRDVDRNARILAALREIPAARKRVLVFACSIEHAGILALALNKLFGDPVAVVLTNQTSRTDRADISDAFRRGVGPRFLCNVDLLATGFDAPRVDAVCITRPLASALRYEQMVGRGLRGPQNGGTDDCLVLDVQDDGLPDNIMSYARVAELWDIGPDALTT